MLLLSLFIFKFYLGLSIKNEQCFLSGAPNYKYRIYFTLLKIVKYANVVVFRQISLMKKLWKLTKP